MSECFLSRVQLSVSFKYIMAFLLRSVFKSRRILHQQRSLSSNVIVWIILNWTSWRANWSPVKLMGVAELRYSHKRNVQRTNYSFYGVHCRAFHSFPEWRSLSSHAANQPQRSLVKPLCRLWFWALFLGSNWKLHHFDLSQLGCVCVYWWDHSYL